MCGTSNDELRGPQVQHEDPPRDPNDGAARFSAAPTLQTRSGLPELIAEEHLDILERLSEGSFGVVHRATERTTGDLVAVKIMTDADNVSIFWREYRILKMLDHPNIVRCREAYQMSKSDPRLALTMDLISGKELYDVCQFRFSEAIGHHMAYQLVSAVTHMHEFHVVHRDLKLENVMLSISKHHPHLTIIDFGLACHEDDHVEMQRRCGSPGYVAPEILKGGRCNSLIDCFASGVILHSLLLGYLPFHGGSVHEVLQNNLVARIHRGRRWMRLSESNQKLISGLMAKNVEARLSAAAALELIRISGSSPSSKCGSVCPTGLPDTPRSAASDCWTRGSSRQSTPTQPFVLEDFPLPANSTNVKQSPINSTCTQSQVEEGKQNMQCGRHRMKTAENNKSLLNSEEGPASRCCRSSSSNAAPSEGSPECKPLENDMNQKLVDDDAEHLSPMWQQADQHLLAISAAQAQQPVVGMHQDTDEDFAIHRLRRDSFKANLVAKAQRFFQRSSKTSSVTSATWDRQLENSNSEKSTSSRGPCQAIQKVEDELRHMNNAADKKYKSLEERKACASGQDRVSPCSSLSSKEDNELGSTPKKGAGVEARAGSCKKYSALMKTTDQRLTKNSRSDSNSSPSAPADQWADVVNGGNLEPLVPSNSSTSHTSKRSSSQVVYKAMKDVLQSAIGRVASRSKSRGR